MKKQMKFGILAIALATAMVSVTSCGKYNKYDNGEVVDNTYTGNVNVTSTGNDPAGDFTGESDSGEYSFAWENSSTTAQVNFDVTDETGNGTVQLVVKDAKGDEVMNVTRPGDGEDSFSGVTEEGKKGTWLVTLVLTNFTGDGSYSLNPKD